MTPKQQRALYLRDLALDIVRDHGAWESMRGKHASGRQLRIFRGDGFIILYRTPFQRLPQEVSAEAKYLAALQGREPPELLPYGLDIGTQDGKKLNIEWYDERFRIASFRRGEWEGELERLASRIAQRSPDAL